MKKIWNDPFVMICIAVAIYFSVQFLGSFAEPDPTPRLQEAQKNYLAGEKAQNVEERKQFFNASLTTLLDLEKTYNPSLGNGKLYYDIGNTFFQLEEYPHALFYYYRAHQLRPNDEKVNSHIALSQNKLGLPIANQDTAFDWLFFFHHNFSLPERLQLFSLGTFLTFLFMSLYLWLPNRMIYLLIYASLIFTAPLFLSVCYSYVFSPVEGVMIRSSALYRDAGEHYAKVKTEPIPAGLKIQVLNATGAGKWLKILTADGTIGYVPEESIRNF